MLTHNKVSIKNVISKIYRDLNIKDEDSLINITEWIGEALGFIKVPQQMERVSGECIKIKNHRAEIPCGLIYLQAVEYNGLQLSKNPGGRQINHDGLEFFYNQHNAINRHKMENIAFDLGSSYRFNDLDSFIMENGWFKTSFPEGDIFVDYDRAILDEEGYPMIPDDESFRTAIFWYVAMKYFFIKSIECASNEYSKYNNLSNNATQKWQWYCGQAGANAMMPDEFTMENIKNNFLRLMPKLNTQKVFFNDLNK